MDTRESKLRKIQSGFDVAKERAAAVEAESENNKRTIERIARKPMNESSKVNIRVHFRYAQWRALHDLANEKQATLQGIILYALDRLFAERGKEFADLQEAPKAQDAFTS